ncbi:MAG TPA: hypothetical protein VLZ50_12865 [Terracidiphilus sp.]|nr:hypothetical protein [Terracidiphilus sp.]
MLKDLFAKMRGTKNWPEVQATVRIVNQFEEPPEDRYELSRKLAEVTAYLDPKGEHQCESITVEDSSLLYDAQENDTFTVRVNPEHLDQYYSSEAARRPY